MSWIACFTSPGWRKGWSLVFFFIGVGAAQAKSLPGWLTTAIGQTIPAQTDSAPAIVLLHEQQIIVEDGREWVETTRYAVRLLANNSQAHATFSLIYIDGTDTVSRGSAYLVKPDGSIKEFGKSEWMDHALLSEQMLYTDFRSKTITAGELAQSGDVFGCEITVRRKQKQGETVWVPSSELPVQQARLAIKMPQGWEARLHWIGRPATPLPEEATRKGFQQWSWSNLPHQPAEPLAPSQPANYVFIKFQPHAQTRLTPGAAFSSWGEVAQWAAQLQNASCDATPETKAAAQRLTAGIDSPAAQIEALCRFVQQCPYAAVDKNIGLGFGCRPRLASQVLATRYGDCKDKVNLLRALLREMGVTAYPLVVSTTTPPGIDPSWPTVLQFNHVIAAIQVPASDTRPATAEAPGLGRLLFFDPTAEATPLGTLPWALQNAQGLLCAASSEGLFRLPKLETNARWRQQSHCELVLNDSGVTGQAALELHGELASAFRHAARRLKDPELQEHWASTLSRKTQGMTLLDFTYTDNWDEDRVTLRTRLQSRSFGQKIAKQRWVLRLDLLSQASIPELVEHGRRQPYLVTPMANEETLILHWPDGFTPEDVPEDVDLQSEFGAYHAKLKVQDGAISFSRRLSVEGRVLDPAQYAKFRQFLLAVAKADQRTMVLRKL